MTEKLIPFDDKGVCGPSIYLFRNLQFLNLDTIKACVSVIQENYARLTKTVLDATDDVFLAKSVEELLQTPFFKCMINDSNQAKCQNIDQFIIPQMLAVYMEKLFCSSELLAKIRPWLVGTLASYMTDEQVASSVKSQPVNSQIGEKRMQLGSRLVQIVPSITHAEFQLLLMILNHKFTRPESWIATASMIAAGFDDSLRTVIAVQSLFPKNINFEYRQIVAEYCMLCAAAGQECATLSADLLSKFEIFQKKYFNQ